MISSSNHQFCLSPWRDSQSLCNDRCQNILYKAVMEHFIKIKNIAALLLASKSFQSSSFGANFLVNFSVDNDSILLMESFLSPPTCFSLQFVPSLHIKRTPNDSEKSNRAISNFVGEMIGTKYLHLSVKSLTLLAATKEDVGFFFEKSSKEWPHLRELTLDHCGVNDSVLEIISKKAVHLRTVSLSDNGDITDAGLEHLVELSGITSLDLTNCGLITDVGFESISKLSNVTSLSLWGVNVGDAGLEDISELSGITSLHFACSNLITDVGLSHVAKLSRITDLDLIFCHLITDAGLEHVAQLPNITSLDLFGCVNISLEAKTKLKTARPNCNIKDDD